MEHSSKSGYEEGKVGTGESTPVTPAASPGGTGCGASDGLWVDAPPGSLAILKDVTGHKVSRRSVHTMVP